MEIYASAFIAAFGCISILAFLNFLHVKIFSENPTFKSLLRFLESKSREMSVVNIARRSKD